MAEIPGFWDVGPHDPLQVEETWHRFVRSTNGLVVADLLPASPPFDNADYFFETPKVVGELKEVRTEFTNTPAFSNGLGKLFERILRENPNWKPELLGGDGSYPEWFRSEFIRLVRPPISRILKKANRQIRETKDYLKIDAPAGVLFFVNDGFTGMAFDLINALACDLLVHSYSSIDCFVYLTVNRYIAIQGSDIPRLVWHPAYSDRANESLVDFINDLGSKWGDFLETEIGPFTDRMKTEDSTIMQGARAIVLPNEERY